MPFIVDPTTVPVTTGMTLLAMRTEFFARGFDYLSTTRANFFLNSAYSDLCEADTAQGGTWPFLERTASGTAPNTFTDLRQVLSVVDSTLHTELMPIDRRTLLEEVSGDLTLTGTPSYWYMEGELLNVYPVSTDPLSIRYVMVPTDMSADTDVPLIPNRYCDLIIDGAVVKAYRDSDNLMSAYALQNTIDDGVKQMADSLIFRTGRAPDMVETNAYHADW